MRFPIQRYTDQQGFIPKTDIDGVDAKDNFLSLAQNCLLENGFIRNDHIEEVETFKEPTGTDGFVSLFISNGYSLISSKSFDHVTQGNVALHILHKQESSSVHRISYVLTDAEGKEHSISIDYIAGAGYPRYDAKPTNISYALANNQLKVNLNVNVTYNDGVGNSTLANLTLYYGGRREIHFEVPVVGFEISLNV